MNSTMNHQLDPREKLLTLTIPGDILSTNADGLREEIFGVLESPAIKNAEWNTLKLDLKAAQMVDSVGLNLIVALIRAVQQRQVKIQTVISSSNIQRTFLFTRLDKQMEIIKV